VVAEGVEDSKTWQKLKALGCDAIQGYYISRPIVADELTSWLLRQPTAVPNRQTSAERPWHIGSRGVPVQGADLTDTKLRTRVVAD
jgi:predicted signal transduction protein with EAL and GGDEF domain